MDTHTQSSSHEYRREKKTPHKKMIDNNFLKEIEQESTLIYKNYTCLQFKSFFHLDFGPRLYFTLDKTFLFQYFYILYKFHIKLYSSFVRNFQAIFL